MPIWFHTFSLAPGVYTPAFARDHRYRVPTLDPERLRNRRVLDVGTFDGFSAFLAEARGACRVIAVDNEQYVQWIRTLRRRPNPRRRVSHDPSAARVKSRL